MADDPKAQQEPLARDRKEAARERSRAKGQTRSTPPRERRPARPDSKD